MNYKYKVYGLGNSLLDYEYLVQDSMLDELEIKKGTMLLNEFDKHEATFKSELDPSKKSNSFSTKFILKNGLLC